MAAPAPLLDALESLLARALDAAHGWRGVALVALVGLACLTPGLASLPVTDRDEARFAQATKQMLETGDLVDIRFQDKPRWKKPAGIYWMQAASATAAGGTGAPIAAYRLPSLAGALGAALLMIWAARPIAGRQGAVLAGAMLAATVLVAGEATIAKTDAMLLFTAVAALGGVARLMPGADPPGLGASLAVWAALGLAVLLKGPIVPVVVLLALAALWAVWRRVPPLGRLRPLPGLALALAIAAPWLVAIWIVTDGAFFEEAVGRDLMGKVAEGQEKHWGPPGLYLALVWLTLWPWAALIPQTAPWVRARVRDARVILVAAWVVPFWVVLEAVPTKLPHYVLPLYPALIALMAAWALDPERPLPSARLRAVSAWLVALPGALLAVATLALPLALEGHVPAALLGLLPLATAGLWLAARAARAARPLAQIAGSAVAAGALYGAVLTHALPALDTVFPSARIAALAEPWRGCAKGPLVSGGYREPSLVFHAGTDTRLPGPGEIARRLKDEPGTLVFLEDRWMRHLERAWGEDAPPLLQGAPIRYFNYNRGDFETARITVHDDPRWAPCAELARLR